MTAVRDRYCALVAAGELRADREQEAAATRLDRLADALEHWRPGGWLRRTLGRSTPPPRGVYLWGGVGRGKSMLMDLFFAAVDFAPKRRVHFHEFMLEVHERLRAARAADVGDVIAFTARDIAQDAMLLAFDEFVVNNTADAAIMSRLFTALLAQNVTLVATSNRPPRELYKDGLNRELFLPFIALVEARLDIVGLNGPTDYRLQRLAGADTWYTPLGAAATAQARALFFRLTDYPPEDAAHVPSADIALGGGRTLHVPKSLKGVAVFSFKRLCGEARWAADYLAVARRYHTVFVMGVPQLGPEQRNEAARFVTLVDALYEHRVKLVATAAVEPDKLYPTGDGSFEFARTVSRLHEMQAADYLAQGHGLAA